jgi:hypothetical protein
VGRFGIESKGTTATVHPIYLKFLLLFSIAVFAMYVRVNRCFKPNLFEIDLSVHGFVASSIMRCRVSAQGLMSSAVNAAENTKDTAIPLRTAL